MSLQSIYKNSPTESAGSFSHPPFAPLNDLCIFSSSAELGVPLEKNFLVSATSAAAVPSTTMSCIYPISIQDAGTRANEAYWLE